MLESIIIILAILFASKKMENVFKIPNPLTVLLLSFGVLMINPGFLGEMNIALFSEEMTVFIVVLVLLDAFILRFEDIKNHYKSILFLSVIAVVLSILIGVGALQYTSLGQYNLSIGAVIVLLAMTLATDPVSVVATFKQYNVPHKIKILAEGESLFNDAMALIMFMFFGIYLMQGNEVTAAYSAEIITKVFVGSIMVGLIFGVIGMIMLKVIRDIMVELVGILLIAFAAFYVAEHMHLSGLLAEIVAIMTLTTIMEKAYMGHQEESKKIQKTLERTKMPNSTVKRLIDKLIVDFEYMKSQKDIVLFLSVITMFVNVFLFVSLAKLINFENLIKYSEEIITVFALTTIIRMLMMGKFCIIKSLTGKRKVDLKAWFVLTFAGIKGGLSIVMLHWLKAKVPNFEHFDMYVAIVTGVILLSMFIYTMGLIATIKLNQKSFNKEIEAEKEMHYLD